MGDLSNEENDLARNFGFDITMSGGNMGMPAAAHQDYLMRCNFLYKEFLSTMSILLKEEDSVKKELKGLYAEKIKNLRFSLYRCQNENGHDPFARKQELPMSPSVWESRGNTPWESRGNTPCVPRALDPIMDEDEDETAFRPQTAPVGATAGHVDANTEVVQTARPKTTGAEKGKINKEQVASSEISSHSEIVGILDPTTERTSNRKITVSKHSFAKVVRPTKITIKHREGNFLVKPMRDNYVEEQTDNVAFDPNKVYKNYDPLNEKRALVRQITSYKTPTIASDMKINNRVPIQKSLRGEDAKRVTVAEIYQNARDRKTRHFKIIARKSAHDKADEDDKDAARSNLLSVNSRPFSRKAINTLINCKDFINRSRANTRLSFRENTPVDTSQIDHSTGEDLGNSVNSGKFRSFLKRSKTADTIDSFAGRDSRQENIENQTPVKVGLLRVPSVDKQSRAIQDSCDSDIENDMRSRSGSMIRRKRPQKKISDISAATEISEPYRTGGEQTQENKRASVAGRGGRRSSIVSMAVPHGERRPSIGSEASHFMKHSQHGMSKTGSSDANSQLGFRAPPKVKSMTDSSRIVKQQMRKDKMLDEKMGVWKRRMVTAGATSGGSRFMSTSKRGSKLRLI